MTGSLYAIRNIFIVALALLIPALAPAPCRAADAKVTGIKHWSNPNYTRIVISLDGKAAFTHRLLKKDPAIHMDWRRLYIDINGAGLAPNLDKAVPINDGLL